MAVYKRKTSKGESQFYHYKFMVNRKYYTGVCTGCTKKKEAVDFENGVKATVDELLKQKNVKALVENFRDEMTGGSDIAFSNAFELFLKKPRKKKDMSDRVIKHKSSAWRDFTEYMEHHYPDVIKLADVQKKHAEEYIQQLRTNGRFNKTVTYKSDGKTKSYNQKLILSNRTCNALHTNLSEIFEKLFDDAGLIYNPFTSVPRLDNETESRDKFTLHELKLISEKADDFIKPIFIIGIATALREGDICTLKWSEVNWEDGNIKRQMSKTRGVVEIPIIPPLRAFLIDQLEKTGDNEYILPEHANMYLQNQSGITWRVKNFLESIGIKTTKKVSGRSRAISVKDVHSLRHSFCYYAGIYGIPFPVVKNIVGHVSDEMTKLYQNHADNEAKHEKMMQMPDLMGLLPDPGKSTPQLTIEPKRAQLHKLVDELPLDAVKAILAQLQRPSREAIPADG